MVTDAGLCLMAIANMRLSPGGEQFPALRLSRSRQDTDQADRQREWREGGAGALESGKAGIKT